jgi:hypothetical protein
MVYNLYLDSFSVTSSWTLAERPQLINVDCVNPVYCFWRVDEIVNYRQGKIEEIFLPQKMSCVLTQKLRYINSHIPYKCIRLWWLDFRIRSICYLFFHRLKFVLSNVWKVWRKPLRWEWVWEAFGQREMVTWCFGQLRSWDSAPG